MNVRIRLTAARAMVIGLAGLILASCGGEQETPSTADVQPPPVSIPEPQEVYLTAAGGEVRFASGRTLSIGDQLADREEIEIDADSFADIQFGDRALTRVSGPSTTSVWLSGGVPERPVLELVVESGIVAVNVSFLAAGEVFRVRTPEALYRVTGTRFSVSSGDGGAVDVSEGTVQVLPPSLDLDGFLESTAADDESIRDALFALGNAAPSVRAGASAQIAPDAMGRSDLLAEQLAEKLEMMNSAAESERPSLVSEFLEILRATSDSLSATVVTVPAASAELAEKLRQIEEVDLLPVPKDPSGLSLLESEDVSNLVKFTLRTVPQNSDIFINNLWVGQSVYEGVLRASDSLSIRVSKEGYRERRLQIDRARSEVVTVQLERLPPSISAESFIKAITADDLATVRTYVQEGGSVNVRTDENVPAVVVASGLLPVLRGQAPDLSYHREILRTVVAAGADLEARFVVEGSTFKLLHGTVLAGVAGFDVLDLLELFADAGADVNGTIVLEGEELTPLALAVRWALYTGETREEIMLSLLEAGASLDVAISFNDELLTLREIAGELIDGGELVDPDLLRALRQAGVPS